MAFDEHLISAIHIESLRHEELEPEHLHHTLFQSSTIAALLGGSYDGDVTFSELAEHGDFGLGTFNALDGEMIALDGKFFRAAIDGTISEVAPAEQTPFAVVIEFDPDTSFKTQQTDQAKLLEEIDRHLNTEFSCYAIHIEGRFRSVHARSVPRQSKPYRPLTEVIGDQRIFDLSDVDGTMVGFRFPHYSSGINVPGYHLHFIDSSHTSGGHVMDFEIEHGRVKIDHSNELHMELPSGVQLPASDIDDDAVNLVERDG